MKTRTIITLLFLIIFGVCKQRLYANDDFPIKTESLRDSIFKEDVKLKEIIITGTRTEADLRNQPMSISIISGKQIEKRLDQSLLPVISEETPGLFVTSRGVMGYGVANGAAGGMTIRGVGGSPTTGVLMLIDGHPQYMGLMGHPLADSYLSMMADKVEIARGPTSVLYGSNAIGGVINIITKKQEEGIKTRIKALYGSYETLSAEINNAVKSGKFNSYVSLNYNRTNGHRSDMDFKQYSGYLKLGYDFSSNWKIFADLNLNKFDASNPGSINVPIIDNDAKVTRGMTSFSLENKFHKTSGAFRFFYNFGTHEINDGYNIGGTPRNYRFKSNDSMLGILIYQSFRLFTGNTATIGVDYQRTGGHAWDKYLNGNPDLDLVDKGINDVATYLTVQQAISKRIFLNAGLRFDYNSNARVEWIPQAGLSYLPNDDTAIKAIVSKGFRNPTIRELYMFQPKNPDLKAESLMNYELSFSRKLLNNSLSMEANVYYIKGNNSIHLVNNKYENTGKIENYGIEFDAKYNINPNISLSANYSRLHMENKVVAAPEHKAYGGATFHKDKWLISTGIQYINDLYSKVATTQSPDNIKESFLLWNIRGMYKVIDTLNFFVRGENLLAQKYEINIGYPMPKTTVFGGINLIF